MRAPQREGEGVESMATAAQAKIGGSPAPVTSFTSTLLSWLFRLAGLAIVDAIAIYLLYNMFRDGVWELGLVIAIVTVLLNIIFLREDLYPLRWVSPGLALLIIIVVYPILFTVYTAFTNYGDGHLLTKPVAIRQIQREVFLDDDATVYDWTAFVSPRGNICSGSNPPRRASASSSAPANRQRQPKGRSHKRLMAMCSSVGSNGCATRPAWWRLNLARRRISFG